MSTHRKSIPVKAYRSYQRAIAANDGEPIVRFGDLYIVGADQFTEVALLEKGTQVAHVSMRHLRRLGNANWAQPGEGGAA